DRDAWAAALPEIARLEIGATRIWVVHDLKELAEDPASARVGVVISGHSHRPRVERQAGLLLLNPGSAGPRRFSLPVAVARLHLEVRRDRRWKGAGVEEQEAREVRAGGGGGVQGRVGAGRRGRGAAEVRRRARG